MITFRIDGWEHPDSTRLAYHISAYAAYPGIINVRFLSSEDVRVLNREYAGLDKPTDVLSFDYREQDEEQIMEDGEAAYRSSFSGSHPELGDIAISNQHVRSQARAAGTEEDTERMLLLMHGTLHILGFDHATAPEQRRMDAVQRAIMQELGRPYRNFGWRD